MRLGDLDELKVEFDLIVSKSETGDWQSIPIKHIKQIIDNAPTVHHPNCDICEDKAKQYSLGFQDGYLTGKERPQGEWIPVSERLPENGNQSYLVTVDYGNGLVCSCQRFFFNDEIGWNDDCVIAWQPLPEPYKEGGEENDIQGN